MSCDLNPHLAEECILGDTCSTGNMDFCDCSKCKGDSSLYSLTPSFWDALCTICPSPVVSDITDASQTPSMQTPPMPFEFLPIDHAPRQTVAMSNPEQCSQRAGAWIGDAYATLGNKRMREKDQYEKKILSDFTAPLTGESLKWGRFLDKNHFDLKR